MAKAFNTVSRLMIAGGMLALALSAGVGAATLGELKVGAGDMSIHLGQGDRGLRIEVSARSCPRGCGIDLTWRPDRSRSGSLT